MSGSMLSMKQRVKILEYERICLELSTTIGSKKPLIAASGHELIDEQHPFT